MALLARPAVEPATPFEASELTPDPCDGSCDAVLDTPHGTIYVGTGWDLGSAGADAYPAAWLVRGGIATKVRLGTSGWDFGTRHLVPWGDGARLLVTGFDAGGTIYQ